LDIYWNILTMHGPIKVKSPNNTSKWQMGFNSAFKGLSKSQCHFLFYAVAEYSVCVTLSASLQGYNAL
jgi:hypothetical protein